MERIQKKKETRHGTLGLKRPRVILNSPVKTRSRTQLLAHLTYSTLSAGRGDDETWNNRIARAQKPGQISASAAHCHNSTCRGNCNHAFTLLRQKQNPGSRIGCIYTYAQKRLISCQKRKCTAGFLRLHSLSVFLFASLRKNGPQDLPVHSKWLRHGKTSLISIETSGSEVGVTCRLTYSKQVRFALCSKPAKAQSKLLLPINSSLHVHLGPIPILSYSGPNSENQVEV